MTLTKSLYIRRNGGLTFWRVARLGGSFYLARRKSPQIAPGAARRAQVWVSTPTAYGPSLRRVRSLDDLGAIGGMILAILYGSSMALGMGMAALAMAH